MNVNSIGSGVKPYAPQTTPNSNTLGELQQQKEALIRQLDAVKAKPKNTQAEQNAAEKQKKELEKQIADIEKKIQSASQKNSPMQTEDLKTISDEDLPKKNKSPLESTGNIIDVLV